MIDIRAERAPKREGVVAYFSAVMLARGFPAGQAIFVQKLSKAALTLLDK
ncbi:hypothetical protein [Nonomuraea basaltis]|nr:hypothetical protein [Nonomuraea basaltis]